MRNIKSNNSISKDSYQTAVKMVNVVTQEGGLKNDIFEPLITDITFEVPKGEIFGLFGTPLMNKLVLEIVANLRNYYSGKCTLVERGMLQYKRSIIPQIFFFNENNMLFENMTVLEYLSFTQNLKSKEYAKTQKLLLDMLVEMGMGYISLTPISMLSKAEIMTVQLLLAHITQSNIVVADFGETIFNKKEMGIIAEICKRIKSTQQTLLFGTICMPLITKCADRFIHIENGLCNNTQETKIADTNQKIKNIKRELLSLVGATDAETLETVKTLEDLVEKLEDSKIAGEIAGISADETRTEPKLESNEGIDMLKQKQKEEFLAKQAELESLEKLAEQAEANYDAEQVKEEVSLLLQHTHKQLRLVQGKFERKRFIKK